MARKYTMSDAARAQRSAAGEAGGRAKSDAKTEAARANAAIGGSVSSVAKTEAVRANAAKPRPGGRVMRPCRYCGAPFSAREINPHQRVCPARQKKNT